jgi:23S rRNA pseudouridine1911/1915/1917 synthase
VNGVVVRRGDTLVGPGDRVELAAAPPPPFPAGLRLVHEDADILVVDKPPGLLTIATEKERERTVYNMLMGYVGGPRRSQAAHGAHRPRGTRHSIGERIFIVHRLDRETSGLIVFAKSPAAKRKLQAQFAARAPERVYRALVEGTVREAEGTLSSKLVEDRALRIRSARAGRAGREAVTRYRVLERRAATTLLELTLETGRRGQIRAQLAAAGHPIVGDLVYGGRTNPLRRVCLHATRLAFVHPDGRRVAFESPMPRAFGRV